MDWTEDGIAGTWRFVNRLWRLIASAGPAPQGDGRPARAGGDETCLALRRQVHQTIAAVTEDLETFHFNRAVARVHELVNAVSALEGDDEAARWARREGFETIVHLIGPMMPHLAEELWSRLGHHELLADTPWPETDAGLLVEDMVTVAVQVRGKLRATIALPRDIGQPAAEAAALALPAVAAAIEGRKIERIIFVPNRIINVVHS
jgi:leucyl-tRNA synthetase